MRPKDCAYIVERLAIRFMALVADHSRQLTEHRAAFGPRTEADAKIIAGLRSEIGAARMAVLERDSLMSERDGLLTQVQDMRAEISRLTGHNADAALHDLLRREYDKALTLCETDEQTPAECIGSLNARIDRLQDDARSDAMVREDLHRINVDLRAEINFLKTLRPKYKVGDKLESYSSAVTIVGVRTVYDCQTDGAEYPVGHSEDELTERYAATHDTDAGKASAESAVRTEPVAEEIKVGDVAKVVGASGDLTAQSDIGKIGEVLQLDSQDGTVRLSGAAGWVDQCDVRKVTT